nr:hypothetical protein [Tanacetum cinerariifolium]
MLPCPQTHVTLFSIPIGRLNLTRIMASISNWEFWHNFCCIKAQGVSLELTHGLNQRMALPINGSDQDEEMI